MKIKSTYFGRDIEFDATEMNDTGRDILIISHDQIKALIDEADAVKNNVQMHTVIDVSEPGSLTGVPGHYVYRSVVTDAKGRRYEAVGESLPETLSTPIARNYPALMAYKRAEDAALIGFFGLPSKVYSDAQIGEAKPKKSVAKKEKAPAEVSPEPEDVSFEEPAAEPEAEPKAEPKAEPEKKEAPAEKSAKDEAKNEPAPASDDISFDFGFDGESEAADEAKELSGADPVSDKDADDPGSFVVTVGRYKGKGLTLSEIYADGESGKAAVLWLAKTLVTGGNEIKEAHAKNAQAFLRLVESAA
jgi:hypothetical protein